MNRSPAVVVAGFVLAALLIVGMLFLGREILQLYGGLGAQFLALSILVIVATMIVASGLRRSGEGAQRLSQIQNKVDAYWGYLQCIADSAPRIPGKTARDLALWASPRVIRVINAKPANDNTDTARRDWLAWLLREIRQDLGQSNMQLKLDSLIDDMLASDKNGVDDCRPS